LTFLAVDDGGWSKQRVKLVRRVTALVVVLAMLSTSMGVITSPLKSTASQIVVTRWGEFEQRSSTVDPVAMLIALTEQATAIHDPRD
jgi:hypothetical protein